MVRVSPRSDRSTRALRMRRTCSPSTASIMLLSVRRNAPRLSLTTLSSVIIKRLSKPVATTSTKSNKTQKCAKPSPAGGSPKSPAEPDVSPDLSQRNWLIASITILIVGAILRLYNLALVPLHHDEGVNGNFLIPLVRNGTYQYNPENYHDPIRSRRVWRGHYCACSAAKKTSGIDWRVIGCWSNRNFSGCCLSLPLFHSREPVCVFYAGNRGSSFEVLRYGAGGLSDPGRNLCCLDGSHERNVGDKCRGLANSDRDNCVIRAVQLWKTATVHFGICRHVYRSVIRLPISAGHRY